MKVSRFILYILFLCSIILMILTIVIFAKVHTTEAYLFYAMTNGSMVFRIFGVRRLTMVIHAVFFIVVFFVLCYTDFGWFHGWFLVSLTLQFVLSLHLMVFRPGRTTDEVACHSGLHALLGHISILIAYWSSVFFNDDPEIYRQINIGHKYRICAQMFYTLLFLLIVLTPQFMFENQAQAIADSQLTDQYWDELERIRKMKMEEQREAVLAQAKGAPSSEK